MAPIDPQFWREVIFRLPEMAVWLCGIVVALRIRRRQPRLALAAGTALAVFVLLAAAGLGFSLWARHHPNDDLSRSVLLAQVISPVISAAAWIVLLCAVFGWRGTQPAEGSRSANRQATVSAPTPNSRQVVFGAVLGAIAGWILAVVATQETPFLVQLFGASTAVLVVLAVGWGAVAGAAISATTGVTRGGIAGGVAGLILVFAWASRQTPERIAWVLFYFPVWFVVGGVALGWLLARGWQAQARK